LLVALLARSHDAPFVLKHPGRYLNSGARKERIGTRCVQILHYVPLFPHSPIVASESLATTICHVLTWINNLTEIAHYVKMLVRCCLRNPGWIRRLLSDVDRSIRVRTCSAVRHGLRYPDPIIKTQEPHVAETHRGPYLGSLQFSATTGLLWSHRMLLILRD
jgi:hypothetical protein